MSYDGADQLITQTHPSGEIVTASYDAAGRALSLCGNNFGACYVDNASNTSSYDAQNQPPTRKLGNTLKHYLLSYNTPLAQLNVSRRPVSLIRSYTYDPVSNVSLICNYSDNQTQNFSYDHRDRLTRAWTVVGTAQAPSTLFADTMGPAPAPTASDAALAPIQAALVVDQAASLDARSTHQNP